MKEHQYWIVFAGFVQVSMVAIGLLARRSFLEAQFLELSILDFCHLFQSSIDGSAPLDDDFANE